MVINCAVFGCNNRQTPDVKARGIHFYNLPSGSTRAEWIRRICRADNLPKTAYVCSLHFDKDDFLVNIATGEAILGKRNHPKLKENAVPSLNLPQQVRLHTATETPRSFRNEKRNKSKSRKNFIAAISVTPALATTNNYSTLPLHDQPSTSKAQTDCSQQTEEGTFESFAVQTDAIVSSCDEKGSTNELLRAEVARLTSSVNILTYD
jgi:hypothetical protein